MTTPYVPGRDPGFTDAYRARFADRCTSCGFGWGGHAQGCTALVPVADLPERLADVVPLPVAEAAS